MYAYGWGPSVEGKKQLQPSSHRWVIRAVVHIKQALVGIPGRWVVLIWPQQSKSANTTLTNERVDLHKLRWKGAKHAKSTPQFAEVLLLIADDSIAQLFASWQLTLIVTLFSTSWDQFLDIGIKKEELALDFTVKWVTSSVQSKRRNARQESLKEKSFDKRGFAHQIF